MKKLLALIAFFTALACFAQNLPTEIKLTNGFVMKDCTILRWQDDLITVKYVGGTVPVRFDNIVPEQRFTIEAHKARELKKQLAADQRQARSLAASERVEETQEKRQVRLQAEAAQQNAAIEQGLEHHQLVVGMTMAQLRLVYGEPQRFSSYTGAHTNDVWTYDGRGKDPRGVPCNLRVYFRDGIVTGWGNVSW